MSNVSVDLFQTFPNLQIGQSDLLQAEAFCTQVLASQSQQLSQPLDLRPGTALYDLVIRPSAVLYAMLRASLLYYTAQNSISGITDSTDTTLVDSMLSNWFSTRNLGTNAVINARLYFAISKNITIPLTTSFSPDGTNNFFPSSTIVLPASSLTFDPASAEYYVDVSLVAQNPGSTANFNTGGLVYFTNFDPYFLRATINYLSQAATNPETNTQFLTRTQGGLSTRNLINTPSISYNVLTQFPAITRMNSFGMGDTQMVRDLIQVYPPGVGSPIWAHSGGYVDVYVEDTTSTSVVQLVLDSNGSAILTGPVLTASRSSISGGSAADTVPAGTSFTLANPYSVTQTLSSVTSSGTVATATLTNHGFSVGRLITISGATPSGYNGIFRIESTTQNTFTYTVASGLTTPATGTIYATNVNPSQDYAFSTNQEISVSFGSSYAGETASFTLANYENSPNVQAYLSSSTDRVLCANYLAKSFNLYLLDFSVVSYSGISPNASTVSTVITTYLASLAPGQAFIMADLVSALSAAGVVNIQTPLGVTYTMFSGDIHPATVTGTIVDALDPPDLTYIFALGTVSTSGAQLVNA